MTNRLTAKPLTAIAFARYGQVIETRDQPDMIINQGMCGRHHALARPDIAEGQVGVSLFDAKARSFPCSVEMVERHPLGSQAFVPMNDTPMLVVVAPDQDGRPGRPEAFLSGQMQGVCLDRNVWHGVLAPIEKQGLFAVIDYVGDRKNLEEHWFDAPWVVEPPHR